PSDRILAQRQEYCAVRLDTRLGAMDKPFKLTLHSETVFLCCSTCEREAREKADRTVSRGRELRSRQHQGGAPKPKDEGPEGEIRQNLAKLSAADRRLAEAQKFCAVNNDSRLGSMGVPVKLMLQGQPVFLCCGGCESGARANVPRTLAT